jgi:hypothetical protein
VFASSEPRAGDSRSFQQCAVALEAVGHDQGGCRSRPAPSAIGATGPPRRARPGQRAY